jgi:hypothetical protein
MQGTSHIPMVRFPRYFQTLVLGKWGGGIRAFGESSVIIKHWQTYFLVNAKVHRKNHSIN